MSLHFALAAFQHIYFVDQSNARLHWSRVVPTPWAKKALERPIGPIDLLRVLAILVIIVVQHRHGDGPRDAPHHALGFSRLAARLLRVEVELREEPSIGGK